MYAIDTKIQAVIYVRIFNIILINFISMQMFLNKENNTNAELTVNHKTNNYAIKCEIIGGMQLQVIVDIDQSIFRQGTLPSRQEKSNSSIKYSKLFIMDSLPITVKVIFKDLNTFLAAVLKHRHCLSIEIFGQQLAQREEDQHIRNKYTRQVPKSIEMVLKYKMEINGVVISKEDRLQLSMNYEENTRLTSLCFDNQKQKQIQQKDKQEETDTNCKINQKKFPQKNMAVSLMRNYIKLCSILGHKFKPNSYLHMERISITDNVISNHSTEHTELIFVPKFSNQSPFFQLRVKFIEKPEGVVLGVIDEQAKDRKRCTDMHSKIIGVASEASIIRCYTSSRHKFRKNQEIEVSYRKRHKSMYDKEVVFFIDGDIRISVIKGQMVPFIDLAPRTSVWVSFDD